MEEQAKAVLKRDDYDAKQRRPKINWDDPQDKILVFRISLQRRHGVN